MQVMEINDDTGSVLYTVRLPDGSYEHTVTSLYGVAYRAWLALRVVRALCGASRHMALILCPTLP